MREAPMSTKAKAARIAGGGGAILSLGASLVVTSASPAGAAEFLVTSEADSGPGTLRDAIALANGNTNPGTVDLITFAPDVHLIELDDPIGILEDVAIVDPEGDVTVDGGHNVQLFYASFDGRITISGLTLHEGVAQRGGAISTFGVDLTITDSTLSGNDAEARGGAVYLVSGELTISNSQFTDNESEGFGGAVFVHDGATAVSGSTFLDNSAGSHGGAIDFHYGDAEIIDTTFTYNEAGWLGGGLSGWGGPSSTVAVSGSTFTGNRSGIGGGASFDNFTSVDITDTTFDGNDSGYTGGGASFEGVADVTITGTTFTGNTSGAGGGASIHNWFYNALATTVTVTGSTFTGNVADRWGGGGLYLSSLDDDTVTIAASTFHRNTVESQQLSPAAGGGILADDAGTVDIATSTISGNEAAVGGGITTAGDTTLSITSSTISGNEATYGGGGLFDYGIGDTTIAHTTIAGNSAGVGGGVFFGGDGTATIDHTLLDGNVAIGFTPVADGPTADEAGSAIFVVDEDLRPNAVESVTLTNSLLNGTVAGEIVDGGGNLFDQPANLGPLDDNGGPTLTHDLLAGSAARNAGDAAFAGPPDTDQRGLPRVSDGRIDIGAVEVQVQEPVEPVEPVTPPGTPAQPVPAQPDFTG